MPRLFDHRIVCVGGGIKNKQKIRCYCLTIHILSLPHDGVRLIESL